MRRKFSAEDGDRIWFTSDTHYGHANLVPKMRTKYYNKWFLPQNWVDEMDADLMAGWNDRVGPNDYVFHLGDLSFHSQPHKTIQILANLNGYKHLLLGNHDRVYITKPIAAMFDGGVEAYHEITVGSQLVVLCHFAFRSWNGMHHNSWNLHGHSHGSLKPLGKQLDVGVDCNGFKPVSYREVENYMKDREFVQVDHHTAKLPNDPKPEYISI